MHRLLKVTELQVVLAAVAAVAAVAKAQPVVVGAGWVASAAEGRQPLLRMEIHG